MKEIIATAIARLGDCLRDNAMTPDVNLGDRLGEWLVELAYAIDIDAAQKA